MIAVHVPTAAPAASRHLACTHTRMDGCLPVSSVPTLGRKRCLVFLKWKRPMRPVLLSPMTQREIITTRTSEGVVTWTTMLVPVVGQRRGPVPLLLSPVPFCLRRGIRMWISCVLMWCVKSSTALSRWVERRGPSTDEQPEEEGVSELGPLQARATGVGSSSGVRLPALATLTGAISQVSVSVSVASY